VLETLQNLALGFSVALTPGVLWYGFIGCLVGTLVGVLPGRWAARRDQSPAARHLWARRHERAGHAGRHLLRRDVRRLDDVDPDAHPGEAASVMTCIDGYAMARKGARGPALTIAAVGSYVAGTVSVVALMVLAPPLADVRAALRPARVLLAAAARLLVLAYMNSGSMLKGWRWRRSASCSA
jgi:putative tricarboxylic transport membrane protein